LILPELDIYLNRVNQNEVFRATVINTVIRFFKQKSTSQDDDLVDPDVEIFVTSKENAGWAELFCDQVVSIHVENRDENSDPASKEKEALPSNRSFLMSVYDIKQFIYLMNQLCA